MHNGEIPTTGDIILYKFISVSGELLLTGPVQHDKIGKTAADKYLPPAGGFSSHTYISILTGGGIAVLSVTNLLYPFPVLYASQSSNSIFQSHLFY